MTDSIHKGSCFCGAVEVTVTGSSVGMGYCHCSSCRAWSASPVNGFTLWKAGSATVTKGKEHVGSYNHKSPNTTREFCKLCGGGIKSSHALWGLDGVYAAVLKDFAFTPMFHVNYKEKVLAIRDGLPKFADLPKDFGGSGETLPEG
jgi:hypothetical protein